MNTHRESSSTAAADTPIPVGMHGLNYTNLYVKKGGTTIKLSMQETIGDVES
ncbi:MAG: hypothetical protein U0361_08400 [Nitrospiraceae bacterium]